MFNFKLARIEKWIKIEITNILQTKVKNPNLKNLTITNVKVTKDLISYATISWTTYNNQKVNVKVINNDLEKTKGFLRGQLAAVSSSYKVPQLRFKYDNTEKKATKIYNILNKIKVNKN